MAQQHAMAEKKKVIIDGVEIPGLVSVAEITLEKSTIEVPSFSRIRLIQSGIIKLPAISLKYRVDRDTETLNFWQNYHQNNEIHDVELIRTDATGTEFARRLLPQCECNKMTDPGYDAANPEYASITIELIPWDIKLLEAE